MFNAGMMSHLSQQQQMALLQQMAQMQMAQMGSMKNSGSQPLSMMIPGAGQFVLVPQNQIQQIQQYQDAQLRQQMHSHAEINDFNLERELANRPDMARAALANQRPGKQPKPVAKNGQNLKPNSQKNQPKALPKRVLVTKLPNHIKTVEALAEVFYPYGIISEIQIFKDRSQLTSGLVEIIAKVDPRQNSMPAATVEFETSQAAKFAVSIMRKREKQLQFRVALLKGDSVDEKHCHNYQKGARRPQQMSSKTESGAETDNHSSSGYDTCSLKSESPRPNENSKAASESGVSSADYYNDHCILEDFDNMSLVNGATTRNLGPIAPPKNMKHKMRSDKKTGQLSRFRATYKGQQGSC